MSPLVPAKVSQPGLSMPDMGTIVDLADAEWERVADLFDPECRRGAPEVYVDGGATAWAMKPAAAPKSRTARHVSLSVTTDTSIN